jgi:CheY-like chemotaxis protein
MKTFAVSRITHVRLLSVYFAGVHCEVLISNRITSAASEFGKTAPARKRAGGRPRILLVDDEESMLTLLKEVVQLLGYDPITAADGTLALRQFHESPVDLVITDIHMPGISGLDLLRQIKKQNPEVPVVLITGLSSSRFRDAAREHHADGFISKPFRIDDLRNCIQRLIK